MIIRSIFAFLSVGFFPILTFAESVHGQVSIVDEPLVFNEAMLVSGIILAVTFIGIFTEMLHGLERMKVAAGGAIVMVIVGQIYGFYNPSLAVEAVDWNVVFLLGAMMTVIAMMIPTGGFDMLAYRIANFSKGRLYMLLALIGTCVTVLSLLLDNVTTVVIFGPLIILIARAQKINTDPLPACGCPVIGYGRCRHPGGRSPEPDDRVCGKHLVQ